MADLYSVKGFERFAAGRTTFIRKAQARFGAERDHAPTEAANRWAEDVVVREKRTA